jgi:hypothetical protein
MMPTNFKGFRFFSGLALRAANELRAFLDVWEKPDSIKISGFYLKTSQKASS